MVSTAHAARATFWITAPPLKAQSAFLLYSNKKVALVKSSTRE
jgi:hypothetical protein